jgi:hypothetical protein
MSFTIRHYGSSELLQKQTSEKCAPASSQLVLHYNMRFTLILMEYWFDTCIIYFYGYFYNNYRINLFITISNVYGFSSIWIRNVIFAMFTNSD